MLSIASNWYTLSLIFALYYRILSCFKSGAFCSILQVVCTLHLSSRRLNFLILFFVYALGWQDLTARLLLQTLKEAVPLLQSLSPIFQFFRLPIFGGTLKDGLSAIGPFVGMPVLSSLLLLLLQLYVDAATVLGAYAVARVIFHGGSRLLNPAFGGHTNRGVAGKAILPAVLTRLLLAQRHQL